MHNHRGGRHGAVSVLAFLLNYLEGSMRQNKKKKGGDLGLAKRKHYVVAVMKYE